MIDWDRVRTLRAEVGAEDFDEVVTMFLEEVDESIARLSQTEGGTTLGEDLHFLKGSAMSLGFDSFSALCQAGETAAEQGNAATIDIDQITQSYATSREAFLIGLPDISTA